MPVFPGFAEPVPVIAVDVAATTSAGALENENAFASDLSDEFGTGDGGLRPITVDVDQFHHHHAACPELDDDHFAVGFDTGAEFDRHRHFHQQVRRLDDPEHKLHDVVADPVESPEFIAGSDRAVEFELVVSAVEQSGTEQQQPGAAEAKRYQVRHGGSAAEHADQYGPVFRHAR